MSLDKTARERIAYWLPVTVGLLALLLTVILCRCVAHAQEQTIELPVMTFPTNAPEATLLKRPAQPMVPPIPHVLSRSITTNVTPDGRWRRRVTTEHEIMPPPPPPLIQDTPKTTNAFWVMCPNCSVRAIRAPVKMETNGVIAVPDGDTIERTIYFRCCKAEFKARNFKFVETPIAEEVTIPIK